MHLRVLRAFVFVLVFFTSLRAFASAPTATTSAATAITTSSAQLNGAGVPNGQQTTGWFRISATNPGTCDDVFGTRVPAVGGTDLGSGAVSVPYSINATGLTSGVTYYFCAIVQNASGTAFGTVLSFTVPGSPVVTTSAANGITSSGATLNGSANPNSASATGWFRYDTTNPGSCNDVFGTRAPAAGGTALGSGTSDVAYSRAIAGLTPGATYYFCAIAQNANGTSFGAVLSFTALANAPIVTTNSATLVTGTTAQLNGSANPGGAATTGWYRYSTTNPGSCTDAFGTRAPAAGGSSLGSGNTAVNYGVGVTGLTPATTYYFCAIASNSVGISFGSILTFTTPAPPAVTTTGVSSIANTSATLEGTATPNGAATTGYFRYSLTNPGTCDDVFGSRAPVAGGTALGSGTSGVFYSQGITGLSAGTTYYFCAIAQNAEGLSFGAVLSFVTAAAPTATTNAATLITSTTATLNGAGDPNGNGAYGYYRYSTTNPGSCSDAFGTRAPPSSASDTYLGTGTSDVAYSRAITRPDAGDDVLLLRDRRQLVRHGVRLDPVVHDAGEPADGDDDRRDAADGHHGDAQRVGEPGRRHDDGLVPLRHGQPGHLQRLVRHARSGGGRLCARRRQLERELLAGDHRADRRGDVLLLRDRLQRDRDRVRRGPPVHDADAAHGRHECRVEHDEQLGLSQRDGQSRRLVDDGLLPLQHDQPRHVRRRVRLARAGGRRDRAGLGQLERGLPAADHGPVGGDDVLLLRDRAELRGDGVRRGPVVHHGDDAGGDDQRGDARHVELGDDQRAGRSQRRPERGLRSLPLRHDRPGLVQRRVRHAHAALQPVGPVPRHGHLGRRVLARPRRAHAGDDVLLLRDRQQLVRDGVRRGDVVHDGGDRADGDDEQRVAADEQHGAAQRVREPGRLRDDGLVPLQPHQPRLVQRRVRHARAGGRRLGARLGRDQRDASRRGSPGSRRRPRTTTAPSPRTRWGSRSARSCSSRRRRRRRSPRRPRRA